MDVDNENRKVSIDEENMEHREDLKRHLTVKYDIAALRKLQEIETWIERSLSDLYLHSGSEAPEIDVTAAANLKEDELNRFLINILAGNIDKQKKEIFIQEFKGKVKEIVGLNATKQ